ncbi:inositol 2-dehydrogenase [candidate division KSB1 bacterium]|nr:inositol 2-dehydrogenase [candidate division KSB1 bacterium]RQW07620.1 MAG: inositol 2-dehydrogenase [candidate division KSB1 bacterium]
MNESTIPFGVIGAGRIGKIHAANLANRIPDARVIVLSDVTQDECKRLAGQLNIAKTTPDYRAVLRDPEVQAIAICASTNSHFDIIMAAADAGKHIFCEKPIDLSIENIKTIDKKIRDTGVIFMVGFNRRFDANFLKIRDLVRSGAVGDPHVVKITSRDPAPPPEQYIRSSGGLFLDMTIHDFDMARYLIGSEIVEVYAQGRVLVDPVFEKAGDIDTATVMLNYESGALAVIDNSRRAVYGYDQRVEVFGSKGMATVTNKTPDNHIYSDADGIHSALPLNFFMERYVDSFLTEMQIFVDCVKKQVEPPVTTWDGLASVAIALAANKSIEEHRPVRVAEFVEHR